MQPMERIRHQPPRRLHLQMPNMPTHRQDKRQPKRRTPHKHRIHREPTRQPRHRTDSQQKELASNPKHRQTRTPKTTTPKTRYQQLNRRRRTKHRLQNLHHKVMIPDELKPRIEITQHGLTEALKAQHITIILLLTFTIGIRTANHLTTIFPIKLVIAPLTGLLTGTTIAFLIAYHFSERFHL